MSRRKLGISIVLLLVFLVAAWVVAGLLATGAQFVIVGVILSTCGLTILGVYILVSRLRPPPVPPSAQPPLDADKDLAKVVQRLIQDANQTLKRSPNVADKSQGSPIHQLGLYVVGGLGAAGKTSTIASSGIGVQRLSGQIDTSGVISRTDVGNFWFAENTVLAEASSAIFCDDSKWRTWLRSLAPSQSGPFLGGLFGAPQTTDNLRAVILFCDVADLVGIPDTARQSALSRSLRERMYAVAEIFQRDFSVYVVFSKADRIAFFQEYFGRLIGDEDQQVFGCTLPRTPGRPIPPGVYAETQTQEVSGAFNALYLSLTDKRLLYLARESDPSRKSGIYEFPREVKRIRTSVVQFLVDAFQPNALKPGPILRGFYFTGVRQVSDSSLSQDFSHAGAAESADVGAATRIFKARDLEYIGLVEKSGSKTPPEKLTPKWAFVTRLFRDVILADRLAAPTVATRKRRVHSSAFISAAAMISAIWILLVSWSFFNNRSLLTSLEIASQLTPTSAAYPRAARLDQPVLDQPSLDQLDALRRNLLALETFANHVPWHLNFLLYAGDLVHDSAEAAYFDRFQKYFLDGANQALADQLSNLPADAWATRLLPYESAYNKLRAYLMITSRRCPSERPFLPNELTAAWMSGPRVDRTLNGTEVFNQFDFYAQHLAAHFSRVTLLPQESVIKGGRSYLALFGNEQRAYQQIIDQANQKLHDSARLRDYASEYQSVLTAHPDEISAAFTRAGWREVQDRIQHASADTLGDSCVTGSEFKNGTPLDDLHFRDTLASLYSDAYASHWREFLMNLHVSPYLSAEDAAKKLTTLDGNSSPLMLALYMVHENTQVMPSVPSKVEAQVQTAATGLFNRFTSRLGPRAHDAVTTATAAAKTNQPAQISRIFEPVHVLFPAEATRGRWAGDNSRKYLDALGSMARAMDALSQGTSSGTDVALNNEASRSYADGRDKVRQIALDFDRESDRLSSAPDGVAKAVNDLLLEPFTKADGMFSRDPDKMTTQKANADLKSFCASVDPLLNKFPFKRNGKDASLAEFASVFSPQSGTLSALGQKISNVAVRASGGWQPAPAAANLQVTPDFLAAMNRLSGISDAFFENRPDAHFEYRLSTLPDPSYQSTKVSVDGRTIANGEAASWPGTSGGLQIVVVSGPANISCSVYSGTWAVFHLLADARQTGPALTYPCFSQGLGGGAVPIEIGNKQLVLGLRFEAPAWAKASFDPSALQGVRCPSRVVETR